MLPYISHPQTTSTELGFFLKSQEVLIGNSLLYYFIVPSKLGTFYYITLVVLSFIVDFYIFLCYIISRKRGCLYMKIALHVKSLEQVNKTKSLIDAYILPIDNLSI